MFQESNYPKQALKKLEDLSENVRIIDQPRSFGHHEVEKLLKIAYLEGQFDFANNVTVSYNKWWKETAEKIGEEIINHLKTF